MKNLNKFILFVLCLGFSLSMSAREPDKGSKPTGTSINTRLDLRMDCVQSTESVDLEINNVRARLWVGGDIWWNRQRQGRYIVPKPSIESGLDEVSSLFAGGVWIGGFDPSGNLKLAASTYPSEGNPDYYAGPLDDDTGLTEATLCQKWDQFFKVKGTEIKKAIRDYDALEEGQTFEIDSVPFGVRFWPGQGNVYFEQEYEFELPNTKAGLGAFWDENQNDVYEPEGGDFPIIDIRGCEPETRLEAKELIPDEMLFWIYNDAGGDHLETFGDVINMEVQVQGFAYATNDEINDMTFLRYKLINRAKEDIRQTYFAMWVDPDLGCSNDDFIGCDVERSLSYAYNVDELDGDGTGTDCGGVPTYQDKVPIIGTDYFRGPIAPKVIVCDSSADMHIVSIADRYSKFDSICGRPPLEVGDTIYIRDPDLAAGEEGDFGFELGMSSFIYHNREGGNAVQLDPQRADQYYTYLEGKWLDGSSLTVGGDGFNAGSSDFTRYAFPDPPNKTDGWSMCTGGENGGQLIAGDRRTIQASGPFLLQPGAVNELIVGAVWVPDLTYPCPDITKLTAADDIAQNLFDNCFDIVDGPDAPTVCPVALDKEIILVLHNDVIESNNRNYSYSETDVFSPESLEDEERQYVFEGYKIFQLAGPNVSPQQLNDIDEARIVAQVDINNGITEIYNWTSSTDPNAVVTGNTDFIWTPELMVSGENQGIRNTIRLTRDIFASGDSRLINHKKYYYMALAYAHNEFAKFNPNNPTLTQAKPYLEGRGNVMTYTVVPRPIVYEGLNAQYGDGVQITRIRGVGVGGNLLDLEDGMHDLILSGDFADEAGNNSKIRYKEGAGPLDVKVYNPLEVRDGKFRLEILGNHIETAQCELDTNTRWRLTNLTDDTVFESDTDINTINEQLIPEYGISLNILQANRAGSNLDQDNGALGAFIEYEGDDAIRWFNALEHGVPDIPQDVLGSVGRSLFEFMLTDDPTVDQFASTTDPGGAFHSLGDGYWYPFMLTSAADKEVPYVTPAYNVNADTHFGVRPVGNPNVITNINNVDVVMTSDKSKWSRCIVVETASSDYILSNGNPSVSMLDIKRQPSVDKNGNSDNVGSKNDPASSNYVYDDFDGIDSDVGTYGYSWFPGYAIDVETGKRLNIIFGENSAFDRTYSRARNVERLDSIFTPDSVFVSVDTTYNETPDRFANGNDMLYNPNDVFSSQEGGTDPSEILQNVYLGGQHFIYVTREEYDGCSGFGDIIEELGLGFFYIKEIFRSVTWCSMSFLQPGQTILSYEDDVIPSDVTMKLRVNKPYNKETEFDLSLTSNNCKVVDGELGGLPVYEFEINGKESTALAQEDYEGALANVNVSPNPYYAYSAYETGQFTKTVKITNVPDRATVTIYSLDGKFIKQFKRDERRVRRSGANPGVVNSQTTPAIEWDLENIAGIPVASGVYLIHIDAPDLGEQRTLKWFGVNRKFDPSGL